MPLRIESAIAAAPTAGIPAGERAGVRSPKLTTVREAHDTDEQLMLRYGRGEAQAFEHLYQRHRAPLWRFVARNLRDEAITADVFQEIWARVVAHRARYEPRAKFTTWLYRIAHHCCVDHWRSSARRQRRELPGADELVDSVADPDAATPLELVDDEQSAARLRAAVATLPDEQREAFLLYAEAGLALAEIGEATGVGTETAKSRLRYAVAKLRRALAPPEPGVETS